MKIFIGGQMPHWIIKFVNALKSLSDKKSKRDMTFRDFKINLGMIEKVWKKNHVKINVI